MDGSDEPDRPTEVELKLEVRPGDLAALMRHPLMRRLGKAKRLVSTYFDTPDGRLARARMALRIRSDGRRHIQTLKTAGDGFLTRGEWECAVASDALDLGVLKSTPLAKVLEAGADLAPRFTIEVERRSHAVFRGGARIELTLDVGEARVAEKSSPILEVELELARGRPANLFTVAAELCDAAPLRPSVRSKAEAGEALLGGGVGPSKSARVVLDRDIDTAGAFQAVGRACLTQFLKNERLVREARAVEAVHQARVAIRRFRAALSLFSPLFGDPESERLKTALRRTGQSLGAARDLDVLIERVRGLELTPSFDAHSLLAALERRRAQAYDEAAAALEAPELSRLLFDVARWLETGDWLTVDDPVRAAVRTRSALDFARETLKSRARKLRKASRRVRDLEPPARHAVRIKAKKLRYGAEFFASLAEGKAGRKAAEAFIEALRPFQDALGELNDLVNAERQLRVLAEISHDPNLAFAAGAAVDEVEREAGRLLKRAEKAAGDFAKAKLFL
ncbi:MAG: CHAD domain-containing protein [Proteobacteria bacterium]|nr:CHAD domain-containing protein [Pseudomonadota bacterium]